MNWDLPPLKLPRKQASMVRKKFTNEEDEKLRKLVKEYGAKKWDQIAQMMPGRTGRQCRDRYRNYLIPGFFNGQWSQEEDKLLHEKFNQMGPQWARMMQFFPGRSANSLKNRWNYFVCRLEKDDEQSNDNVIEYQNNINNNFNIPKIENEISSYKAQTVNEIYSFNQCNQYNQSRNESAKFQNQSKIIDDVQIQQKEMRNTEGERVIYGVNVSTQTNESEFLEPMT